MSTRGQVVETECTSLHKVRLLVRLCTCLLFCSNQRKMTIYSFIHSLLNVWIKVSVGLDGCGWGSLAHNVLQRMSVGGNESDGRRPLVVLLVELLVEAGMVEQPVRRRQGENKTALALHFFHSQTLINHGFKENQSLDNLPFPFSSK